MTQSITEDEVRGLRVKYRKDRRVLRWNKPLTNDVYINQFNFTSVRPHSTKKLGHTDPQEYFSLIYVFVCPPYGTLITPSLTSLYRYSVPWGS